MAKKAAQHYCARCEQSFSSRQALNKHLQTHPDSGPTSLKCPVCPFFFNDSLALEQHKILNGHLQASRSEEYKCDRCPQTFNTKRGYNRHRELGQPCSDAEHSSDWKKRHHTGPPEYIDLDKPKVVSREVHELTYNTDSTGTPSDMGEDAIYCHVCKRKFASEFAYDCHSLGCNALNSKLTPDSSPEGFCTTDRSQNIAPTSLIAERHTVTIEVPVPHTTRATSLGEASHPMPLQSVTLNTRPPVVRQPLPPASTPIGPFSVTVAPTAPPQAMLAQRGPVSQSPYQQAPPQYASVSAPTPLPTSQNIGGALEIEQAKFVCGKTLRLLLQTDIFIHHDGKMKVSGIDWTRIGVQKQPDVVNMFDGMCHLPRVLQPLEYVPAPKTFLAEYTAQYPVTEFESAPNRNPAKPGLGIIAMACSKIVLSNGLHEIVKIAAIDVLTCRVLMSHLVCSDPNVQVADWHKSVTGLSSYDDMEAARQAGYKVMKGWKAARSALFKFVDEETIIVGHNLRSELDALRVIHGRAVDIVKVVEKAAQGPLSKAQVSLDSWCRDVANVATLKRDDKLFGRDCIMGAFAVREIGLWVLKNRENFEKVAKQKSKDYQSVNPTKV